MLNILIADDHSVVRKGLIQILKSELKIGNLGEASNTLQVQELLRECNWDILILDLSMPGKNGIELIKDIKIEYRALPILVLSIYPEEQFALRVIKAGASGYMNKESSPEELVDAVKKIISGKKYISSKMAETFLSEFQSNLELPVHKKLSDREYQVFLMLVKGNSLTTIGDKLNLSVKTVSTYQSRIFKKTNLRSIAELVRYAIENKLLILEKF